MPAKSKPNASGVVFGILFFLAILFFAVGFFYPDPYLASGRAHGVHAHLITALKISAVLFVVLSIAFIAALNSGLVPQAAVYLIPLGVLLAGFLVYPFICIFVAGHSGKKDVNEFHTYLQLKPQTFELRNRAAKKILALGGSTTRWPNSKGVQWTALVEEKIAERCGKDQYQAYNQGQDWYTTLHSIINYSTNIRQYRPDTVLIMHGINDMMHNADFNYLSSGPFRNDYGHYLGPIAQLVHQKKPLELVSAYLRRYWYYNGKRTHIAPKEFKGIPAFKQNLNTLVDLVRLDGGEAILMTEAFSYKTGMSEEEMAHLDMLRYEAQGPSDYWELEDGIAGMRAYAEAVRDVARERNAPLIDLEAAIPKKLENFLDDVHFTDKGFPLVVESVSDSLLKITGCAG